MTHENTISGAFNSRSHFAKLQNGTDETSPRRRSSKQATLESITEINRTP